MSSTCGLFAVIIQVAVSPIIWFLSLGLCAWLFLKFVKAQKAQKIGGKNKCLTRMSVALFVFIILTQFIYGVGCIYGNPCFDRNLQQLTIIVGQTSFSIQLGILNFLWFHRLRVIFDGTLYALSCTTQVIFYGAYVFSFAFAMLCVVALGGDAFVPIIATVIIATGSMIAMIWVFSLIGLYLTKLIAVSKSVDVDQASNTNVRLMNNVTKTFVLTIASILSYGIQSTTVVAWTFIGIDKVAVSPTVALVTGIDLTTNFISIMFGYGEFEGYYLKIFGSCHGYCLNCFSRGQEVKKDEMSRVESEITATI